MELGYFKLDYATKTALPCELEEWAEEFGNPKTRRVAWTEIGPFCISTIFLGIDHSFGGGPPMLFETMIFLGEDGEYQRRSETWDDAELEHNRAVSIAQERVRLAELETAKALKLVRDSP